MFVNYNQKKRKQYIKKFLNAYKTNFLIVYLTKTRAPFSSKAISCTILISIYFIPLQSGRKRAWKKLVNTNCMMA